MISAAFFFYSGMNLLDASDIIVPSAGEYLEVWGSLFNFIILVLFFLSMITKE
jgi:hypothetical protein